MRLGNCGGDTQAQFQTGRKSPGTIRGDIRKRDSSTNRSLFALDGGFWMQASACLHQLSTRLVALKTFATMAFAKPAPEEGLIRVNFSPA